MNNYLKGNDYYQEAFIYVDQGYLRFISANSMSCSNDTSFQYSLV